MEQFYKVSATLGQTQSHKTPILGVRMDIPEDERFANDMTKTGIHCPKDGNEMERVSASDMHVCHWCGGQWRIDEKGQVKEVQFEGFE